MATKNDTPPVPPFMDVTKMFEQFKMPGVDVSTLIEGRRKDIEALVQVNQQAYQGVQALTQRQTEIMTAAANAMQASLKEMAGKKPNEIATQQAELAKQAFDRALIDMRELAEIVAKSQSQAYEALSKRFQEHVEEFKRVLQPPAAK